MNALLIGGRGVGKSTLSYYLAVLKARVRFIFDPNDNYRAPATEKFYTFDNLEELEQFLEQKKYATFDTDKKDFDENGNFIAEFTVRYLPDADNIRAEFNDFIWIIRRHASGTYAIILDESDEIQSAARMEPQLAWVMRRAPRELDAPETAHIFQCTHSPQDIYSKSRNLCSDWFFFRTQGVAELEYIEKLTGDKELVAIVRELPPRHFVHWRALETGGFGYTVEADPDSWFIEIGSNKGAFKAHGDQK